MRTATALGRFPRRAAAVIALAALVLAGCSAGEPPLSQGNEQGGVKVCAPAPFGSTATPAWNSPVGFAVDWYYNTSATPVMVESVSLIDPHNLTLRQSLVYEAAGENHWLASADGWPHIGDGSDPVAWAHRQPVPGALINPDAPHATSVTHDAYQVVLNLSATTPQGGYAIGVQVTYKQGDRRHTIKTYSGYAIKPPGHAGELRCSAMMKATDTAWQALSVHP